MVQLAEGQSPGLTEEEKQPESPEPDFAVVDEAEEENEDDAEGFRELSSSDFEEEAKQRSL